MSFTDITSPNALTDTRGAAVYTGLSVSLLEKLRLTGGGPPFARLTPKAVRYRYADLDKWIARRTFHTTAEADRLATAVA